MARADCEKTVVTGYSSRGTARAKSRTRGSFVATKNERIARLFCTLANKDAFAVRARYFEGVQADEIAAKLQLSRRTLFRELERIRKVLMDCIDKKLAAPEG